MMASGDAAGCVPVRPSDGAGDGAGEGGAGRAPEMTDLCTVTVSTPTEQEAAALGRLAVEQRVAACAQVSGPVRSTFRWDGEVTTEQEWLCTFKTARRSLEHLVKLVNDHHSYDLPEVVAVPIIGGSPGYLAWVEAESTGP